MNVVAIDLGLKRIGVAVLINSISIPQNPIIRKNRNQAASELSKLLKEFDAKVLVVGIPFDSKSQDEQKKRATHFISLLEFSGEIAFVDESFSSFEAFEQLKGIKRFKKDGKLDSLAAKIILDRWLEKSKNN